jgi:hypothetical protein
MRGASLSAASPGAWEGNVKGIWNTDRECVVYAWQHPGAWHCYCCARERTDSPVAKAACMHENNESGNLRKTPKGGYTCIQGGGWRVTLGTSVRACNNVTPSGHFQGNPDTGNSVQSTIVIHTYHVRGKICTLLPCHSLHGPHCWGVFGRPCSVPGKGNNC